MENKHYEPVAYLPKEQAERFQEFLKFSGIADIEMNVNELNSTYSVSVASGDFEKADNLYHVFSENELKKDSTEDELTQGGSIYNNSAEKIQRQSLLCHHIFCVWRCGTDYFTAQ